MRGFRIVVLAATLALSTSGCWLESGQSAGRAGFNPFESQITAASVSQLGVAWQHQLTGPVRESLLSPSSPTAYVPSNGALTAYDLASGSSKWSDSGMPAAFDPMLVGGQLAVTATQTSSGCRLDRLDPATGSIATPMPYGQSIGVPSDACIIPTALGTDTVFVPWTQVSLSGHSALCPTNNTESVYYGNTSIARWELRTFPATVCYTGNPPLPPLTDGTPTQVGNSIVWPTGDTLQLVTAIDATNGRPLWTGFGRGGTLNGPVVALANGDIAWTTTAGLLVVEDATGQLKWSAQLDTTLVQPPAASQTTIFVATPSGALDALPVGGCNATTCSPVWHATLASPASVRPSIGGNVVYVGSNDGTVTAFAAGGCNASTCSSLWSGSTGSKITGAPAIGQGAVVVGSDDGTVTAFRLQPQT